MIRRPPTSTRNESSAASEVYKRQEYNAALNENDMTAKTIALSRGGYLNAGIRWTFVERLHLEMNFNNLLFDDEKVDYFKRELKITYIEYF